MEHAIGSAVVNAETAPSGGSSEPCSAAGKPAPQISAPEVEPGTPTDRASGGGPPEVGPAAITEAALAYLEMGLSVIPVNRDKKPLIPWKEYQQKSATAEQVAVWWKTWPDANIAIVTGRISNLVVLDADGAVGLGSLKALNTPATTWLSRTGRTEASYHQYFSHTRA